jgi:tetratricopeptide (TPR) repeat protein
MSYINDALKKAQRERDSRYKRFGGIIASGSVGREKSVKRKYVIGLAIGLIVLIPAVLVTVYLLQRPSAIQKGAHAPAGSGEKTTLPGGSAATAQPDEKPTSLPASDSATEAANRREAEIRYGEALAAQRNRDFKRAEDLYQQVLVLDRDHVRAMNNLGVLFLDQKKRKEAVALFNRAIVLNKEYVDPHYNLACVYGRMNEIEESLLYLKKAIAINKEAIQWALKDDDLKNVVASEEFKKVREGQKN